MSKNILSKANNKVFIVNNESQAKSTLDNPKISNLILKNQEDKESDFFYSSKGKRLSLIQIDTNIDAFEFIERVKSFGGIFSEIKLIPCQFMRSICIRNINPLSPVIDVYYAMHNLTPDVKRITMVDDTAVPGINQKICFVEYNSFSHAKSALSIFNSKNSVYFSYPSQTTGNSYLKLLSSNQPLEAVWCEPFVDCAKEILKNSPLLFFENLNVNNYNIFHFKQFLENHLKSKLRINNCFIKKIRQYTNKVMVEFDQNPDGILDSDLIYEGSVIPIVPAMRPNSNVGKYREKTLRASVMFMKEEDKKNLFSRFGENFNQIYESTRKLAENAYIKFVNEEKREKEKEREKEKKRSKSNSVIRHKRQRKEEEGENIFKEDKLRDSRKKGIKEKSNEKESRYVKEISDRSLEKKSTTTGSGAVTNPQALLLQGLANANLTSPNILNQLTSLLINNPNSGNILANLQNFSALANLQSIISNPGILTAIQQLSLLNQTGGLLNNPSNSLLNLLQIQNSNPQVNSTLNPNTSASNINSLGIPLNSTGNITKTNLLNLPNLNNSPNATLMNPLNHPNTMISQSNPIYNLPTNNSNQLDNSMYFQQNNQLPLQKHPYYHAPSNTQSFNYSMPNMMGMPTNQNEMFMNQPLYNNNLQDYGMIQGQQEMENDPNMMKKYYEYLQSVNK